jgi:anti-sigma factor RsiW
MRCKDIHRLASDYLDGELDMGTSSAVRGHLRQCAECTEHLGQLRAMVDAAGELEPGIEPPASLWDGIQARLAEEEVADSEHTWLFWRLRSFRWPALGAAVALALVVVALKVRSQDQDAAKGVVRIAEQHHVIKPGTTTHQARVGQQLERADQRYLATIAELRGMLEEEREAFTEDEWQAIESRLQQYDQKAIALRVELAPSGELVSSRDRIYRSYRDQIQYMQAALAGEVEL